MDVDGGETLSASRHGLQRRCVCDGITPVDITLVITAVAAAAAPPMTAITAAAAAAAAASVCTYATVIFPPPCQPPSMMVVIPADVIGNEQCRRGTDLGSATTSTVVAIRRMTARRPDCTASSAITVPVRIVETYLRAFRALSGDRSWQGVQWSWRHWTSLRRQGTCGGPATATIESQGWNGCSTTGIKLQGRSGC